MNRFLSHLRQTLSESLERPIGDLTFQPVGGGCINQTGIVSDELGARFFLKLHEATRLANFESEAEGLRELRNAACLRVPEPLIAGCFDDKAFLLLEAIDLQAPHDRCLSEQQLGSELAALHRNHGSSYGWHRDNVIGDTPQRNTPESDWITFFREHRLRFQIDLAAERGLSLEQAPRLLDQLPSFFTSYEPPPSLLHGDLWSGNVGFDQSGRPVIYDPAVYHGDRETDIAFTEMFGGFGAPFYRAYTEAYRLDVGYEQRRPLYNLYHVLNHYNLFGGHYGRQAEEIISRLLA